MKNANEEKLDLLTENLKKRALIIIAKANVNKIKKDCIDLMISNFTKKRLSDPFGEDGW